MKLTPLDIEHQEFDGALNGYNKRQVREFLARVAEVFENSLRESQTLRKTLSQRDARIEELQLAEVELKRAVISAERIGNELKANAKREAELTLQEAEAARERMLRDAENDLKDAKAEFTRLENERRLFREQFRGLLRAYERSLDNLEDNPTSKGKGKDSSILLDD